MWSLPVLAKFVSQMNELSKEVVFGYSGTKFKVFSTTENMEDQFRWPGFEFWLYNLKEVITLSFSFLICKMRIQSALSIGMWSGPCDLSVVYPIPL